MSENSSLSPAMMALVLVVGLGFTVMVGVVVMDAIGGTSEGLTMQSESFGVDNPLVDRICTLSGTPVPGEPLVVRYYDGYSWVTLTVIVDYVVVGNTVTVYAAAMS